jgi:multidrug efflux pump subunit AcrA (membrane-fusion protein)
MTTDQMHPRGVSPGQSIVTSDGEEIGTVKEVRGDAFKVDASLQPDYWLRLDDAQPDGDRVRLAFPKDALADHKLDRPLGLADADAIAEDHPTNPTPPSSS